MANPYIQEVLGQVKTRNASEPEFLQAVEEVLETLEPVVNQMPDLKKYSILERIVEPERVIMFRVPWVNDEGKICVNRAYRVQFNSALGPYKGGLRFHASVNLSILKFSLTGFQNSSPRFHGRSRVVPTLIPRKIRRRSNVRFCQSFMANCRHIGANTDVPCR